MKYTTDADLKFRAEKHYKNKKNGFQFLLNEIISNAIHSCIMSNNDNPKVNIDIQENDKEISLKIKDNGEGFNSTNYENFKTFDQKNKLKEENGFPSYGQGRLVLFYYSDNTKYTSIYQENGKTYKREFNYPVDENNLFNATSEPQEINTQDIYTCAEITIKKRIDKAKNFFKKYDSLEKIKQFISINFFPLLQKVSVTINYNGKQEDIEQSEFLKETFQLQFENNLYNFELFILNSDTANTEIQCFAKNVLCQLSDKNKILYDLDVNSTFYLTSKYFDEHVDIICDKIEVYDDDIKTIQQKIDDILDKKFENNITTNKNNTKKEIKTFKSQYPSFAGFVEDENILTNRNAKDLKYILKQASEVKRKAECDYWNGVDDNKYEKEIIKSGLFDYFKHRENILKKFSDDFLEKLTTSGEKKPENEAHIHEILFQRNKEMIDNSIDKYFNHNLWLIDDKFSLFHSAQSTVNGQHGSDIYLYCDNNKTTEVVIIELKSTHNAHNPKDMIKKLNEYAENVSNGKNTKGTITNTENAKYTGYIICSKEDIETSISSARQQGAKPQKIPFLSDSYYLDSEFREDKTMRIELVSYKDLFILSESRNKPIIDLMYKYKQEE